MSVNYITNGYVYYAILFVIPTCLPAVLLEGSESFFNHLIFKDRFPTRFACVNDNHEALLSYVLVSGRVNNQHLYIDNYYT